MEPSVTAVLINAQGWQKQFRLPEGIFIIGTAADSFIRLPEGENIAPYQVQIVNNEKEAHVRLVNLSGNEMILARGTQETMVTPHAMHDLFGNETLYLGGYKLQFEICKAYIPKQIAQEQNQQVVGLRMVLPSHVLHPGETLNGTLYLRNLGSEACQFHVELSGLPPECYEIDPLPLINPGGEETSGIRIYHHLTSPAAGSTLLTLRISAPGVYPGRELTLQQTLKVYPSYQFRAVWGEAAPLAKEIAFPSFAPVAQVNTNVPQSEPVSIDDPASPRIGGAAAPVPPAATERVAPLQREDRPISPNRAVWGNRGIPTEEVDDRVSSELPKAGPTTPVRLPDDEPLIPSVLPGTRKRPNLSGVKVIQGNTGEFLEEKGKQS